MTCATARSPPIAHASATDPPCEKFCIWTNPYPRRIVPSTAGSRRWQLAVLFVRFPTRLRALESWTEEKAMNRILCGLSRQKYAWHTIAVCLAFCVGLAKPAGAQFTLTKISVDKLTNSDSVHRTEVEPDFFAWGNTIVGTFHVARVPGSIGWGSGDIGWSTSTDAGKTWTYGVLPALTKNYKNGPYGWAADPSVAYDAKHKQWLISTLPLAGQENSGVIGDVAVSRSTDGIHWGKPINIDKTHLDDKNWSTCDNTSTSPYYGHCYTEWDQAYGSGDVLMSVSKDGGKTWSAGKPSADHAV